MARRSLVLALAASALVVSANAFLAPLPLSSLLHPRAGVLTRPVTRPAGVASTPFSGRSPVKAPASRTRVGMPQRMTAAGAVAETAEAETFSPIEWRKHWYPVAFEEYTTKDKPFAFTLMGTALVIWFDFVSGEWRAVSDKCPHRLAPLSEGRINAAGEVECPYHGWAFEGATGKCTSMPQKPAADAMPAKACVLSFPTAAKDGVIWVWGEEVDPPH